MTRPNETYVTIFNGRTILTRPVTRLRWPEVVFEVVLYLGGLFGLLVMGFTMAAWIGVGP